MKENKLAYDKISTYFKVNLKTLIPMAISALFFDGLMCLIPQIEGKTINSLNDGSFSKVLRLVTIFIALVLFVQVNRFVKRYLVRVFANKMTLSMRRISFKNLLNKDMSYFINNNTGDILNRNLSDIYDTTEGIRKITTEVFDTIVLLIGYLISMFIMDYRISLCVLIFIALSILSAHFMKKLVYKYNKSYKEYLSINKDITITKLNNELYYRGLGVSSDYFKKYEESTEELRKRNVKALIFQSSLEPVYSSIALLGVFFIIYFGGKKVIDEAYLIGTLSAYLTTYLLVARKAAKVGKLFNSYQSFKVSWARCRDYLKDNEEILSDSKYDFSTLRLKDFSYSYENFKLPLINLEAHKGEIIGVCGKVHTGKSTVLKALCGLYPYDGEARLDNTKISDLSTNKYQYISYCQAEPKLFSDTIEKNISLNRDGNLDQALTISNLDSDLEELGGINKLLSHSNSNISGGQQKRVEMARAFFHGTFLILLDDPFQSVNKEIARNMIKEITKQKNSIIILVSNNKEILSQTSKLIYLKDNKAYIDTYSNLYKNNDFYNLMEG